MENKEIDLKELVKNFLFYIKKNIWFLLLIFVLGAGIGLGYYKTKPQIFSTSAVFSTSINKELLEQILIDIKYYADNNLVIPFEIDEFEDDKELKLRDFSYSINSRSVSQLSNHYVRIYATSNNYLLLNNLNSLFLNYIKSNEYLMKYNKNNYDILENILEEVDYELREHKNRSEFMIEYTGDLPVLFFGNRMQDAKNSIELTQKRGLIKQELNNTELIEFIRPFTEPTVKKGMPYYVYMVFFSLFLTFIGVIVKEFLRITKQVN